MDRRYSQISKLGLLEKFNSLMQLLAKQGIDAPQGICAHRAAVTLNDLPTELLAKVVRHVIYRNIDDLGIDPDSIAHGGVSKDFPELLRIIESTKHTLGVNHRLRACIAREFFNIVPVTCKLKCNLYSKLDDCLRSYWKTKGNKRFTTRCPGTQLQYIKHCCFDIELQTSDLRLVNENGNPRFLNAMPLVLQDISTTLPSLQSLRIVLDLGEDVDRETSNSALRIIVEGLQPLSTLKLSGVFLVGNEGTTVSAHQIAKCLEELRTIERAAIGDRVRNMLDRGCSVADSLDLVKRNR